MGAGIAGRVVALEVDRGRGAVGGRYTWGSGCLVGPYTVLTAAHVLVDAVEVRVRGADLASSRITIESEFVGDPARWDPDRVARPDLAILTLLEPLEVGRLPVALVDREHPTGVVNRVRSLGYPLFAETGTPGGATRIQMPVFGQLLLSEREDGLLDFQATIAPPPALGAGASQWSGMSGAPVFADDHLIGVITEHAPRKGPSNVAVIPLTALNHDPAHPGWGTGVPSPDAWWDRLGVGDAADLPSLPIRRTRPVPPYFTEVMPRIRKALHERMPSLLGRDDELREIAAFATGDEGHRWLTGQAWAGKSALMYAAVTAALPTDVDVVCYFLRRVDSDADSRHFMEAVIPQLAYLCDADPPSVLNRAQFWDLWTRAAELAKRTGRHLLLVVDGLDEDLLPSYHSSVARLLDLPAGRHAHVLVTSRPDYVMPHDLSAAPDHFLATLAPVEVMVFPGGESQSELARAQLTQQVQRAGEMAFELLGFLTAAAGPLTAADLASLTRNPLPISPTHRRAVMSTLEIELGRLVQRLGADANPAYQYAHASLLEQANSQLAEDLPHYRSRIDEWAASWAERGWPDPDESGFGTPQYLLDAYPTSLSSRDTREELVALASDVDWLDTSIRATSVDAVLAVLLQAALPGERRTADLRACVGAQAANLRPPHPVAHSSHTIRSLAFEAMLRGMSELADELRERLAAMPGELMPVWTSARRSLPAVEVGVYGGELTALRALPDGRVVAGGRYGELLVWDSKRPGPTLELGNHRGVKVVALAALADGRVVSGGVDGDLLVWDPRRPGPPLELGNLGGHELTDMGVLSNGLLVTGATDGSLRIWDPDRPGTNDIFPVFDGLLRSIGKISILGDGRVAIGGGDKRIVVWDPDDPYAPVDIDVPAVARTHVCSMTLLADGRVATVGGSQRGIMVWEPDGRRDPISLGAVDGRVDAMRALPDGRLVTGDNSNNIRIWDIASPGAVATLGRHDAPIVEVDVLPAGQIVAASSDGRVWVWDADILDAPPTGAPVGNILSRERDDVSMARMLPDGRIVGIDVGGDVWIWNAARSGAPVSVGTHAGVTAMTSSPGGPMVTGDWKGRIWIWDPEDPDARRSVGAHEARVAAVAVMPDGRVVSGGDDDRLRVWDLDNPGSPLELGRHDWEVSAVAALRDGRVVSGGWDRKLRLWDTERPNQALELGDHEGWVRAIDELPDGRIVTGGSDGRVRLWDPEQPGIPVEIGAHEHGVHAVAALGSGRLASSGLDNLTRVWDVRKLGQPLQEINEPAHNLTTSPATRDVQYLALVGRRLTLWRVAGA